MSFRNTDPVLLEWRCKGTTNFLILQIFRQKKFKKSAFFYILPAFWAFQAGKIAKKSPASYHYGAGANTKIIQ